MSSSSTNGVRIDDSHEWDQLSRGYNFPSPRNRRPVFVNLLRAEARRIRERTGWVRALDIGCGTGISEDARVNTAYLGGVREVVDELWGVEPDTSVQPASHFDRVFSATLESLNLGGQTVSLAYSYMVQEHIEDADAFFRALYNVLTPGGVYLGLTVNARHGFAIITRMLRALRLDEVALQIVRRRETGYHYPVRYQANGMAQLRRIALEVGFDAPSFITLEADETIGYFKGPLKLLYWLMQWKRRALRRPGSLLTLIVRLEKPNV